MNKEIPLKQLERQSQRIGTIIEQGRAALGQIGQARLDASATPQAHLDTALRVGRAREWVGKSIGRLEQKQSELSAQVYDAKIAQLRSYVDQGLLPPSVLEPLQEVTVFPEAPAPEPESIAVVEKPQPVMEKSKVKLPGGRELETASPNLAKLFEALYTGPMSSADLQLFILGEVNPENNKIVRHLIGRGIKRLAGTDITIRNLSDGAPALYSLEETEETAPTPTPPPEPAPPATVPKPEVPVTHAPEVEGEEEEVTRTVILLDNISLEVTGALERQYLEILANGRRIRPGKLAAKIYGKDNPVNRKNVGRMKLRVNERKLNSIGLQVESVRDEKGILYYQLKKLAEQAGVERTELHRRGYAKESIIPDFYEKRPRIVELPGGRTIEVDSAWTYYMSHYILQRTNTLGQIASQVFPEDNRVTRSRVSAAIPKINHVLRDTDVSVKLIRGKVVEGERQPSRIEFVIDNQVVLPVEQSAVVETPILQPKPKLEVIPYKPKPEEMRTTEETRIIGALNSQLLKSAGGIRIYFDQLQASIKSEDKMRVSHGEQLYWICHADEIKKLFESGIRKLRDESVIPGLREKWGEQDETLWQETQGLIRKLSRENDFEEYVRLVKALVDSSERLFYRQFPPKNGGKRTDWIKL